MLEEEEEARSTGDREKGEERRAQEEHLDELVGGEHLVVQHRLCHQTHLAVERVRALHTHQLPAVYKKRTQINSLVIATDYTNVLY